MEQIIFLGLFWRTKNEFFGSRDKLANNLGNSTRYLKFNNVLSTNNLIDLGHIDLPFTWWNSRKDENTIFERLDRVVVNPLIPYGLTCIAKHMWNICLL